MIAIRVNCEYNALQIFFGDVLHLKIAQDRLVGIQSWTMSDTYCIEYSLNGGAAILTEYDDRSKWESILAELAKLTMWRTVV